MTTTKIERCCGTYCPYDDCGGPHWGDVVIASDEHHGPVHTCQAHARCYDGLGSYDPPPEGCLTIREDDEEVCMREEKARKAHEPERHPLQVGSITCEWLPEEQKWHYKSLPISLSVYAHTREDGEWYYVPECLLISNSLNHHYVGLVEGYYASVCRQTGCDLDHRAQEARHTTPEGASQVLALYLAKLGAEFKPFIMQCPRCKVGVFECLVCYTRDKAADAIERGQV